MAKTGKKPKVLGLDISTKTIGWALFDIQSKDLLELTHFSPKIKVKTDSKVEEMMIKVDQFKTKLQDYQNFGITKVIIEEPLISSNNIRTVATLIRYNSFITRVIYDVLGILPEFISTYDSRKFAFPSLFTENKKGKKVLFGAYTKGCDKKHIIWQKVSDKESHLTWVYTRNNTLKKENYDMCDAYTCVLGQMNKINIW
ncbi:hypothetical protein N9322_01755 [bacterium]|jgi:hypothetical protein|nr:hypothetical protein [bacterium]|tara:strand:- start:2421 stop:3017 length:597 start_codon:yes stop_codon:yes gene_type:complete